MSYSPMAFNTATAGRAGFVRLGSGIGGNSDGTIVSNATLLGLNASSVGLGNVTNESKATMFANPTFTSSAAGRINFSGTATLATGNAFNFGTNAYSALVETGNNDIALVHGAYHVKGTLNSWIGSTPAYHATALVMGVEQQVGGKKFVFKSAPDQTGSAVTWNDVMYIDNSDDLYTSGNIFSSGQIYSDADVGAGTGICLPVQTYTLTTFTTPTTVQWPSTAKFFPAGMNLGPNSFYEIKYKMWLDNLSVASSVFYFSPVFNYTPQNWSSYSTSQYSSSNDGSGMRNVVLANKTAVSGEQAGISYLYSGTPHYIELTFVVQTNLLNDTEFNLNCGTSSAGGNARIGPGSSITVTKLPSSAVGNYLP
jgi:hypothetical protein